MFVPVSELYDFFEMHWDRLWGQLGLKKTDTWKNTISSQFHHLDNAWSSEADRPYELQWLGRLRTVRWKAGANIQKAIQLAEQRKADGGGGSKQKECYEEFFAAAAAAVCGTRPLRPSALIPLYYYIKRMGQPEKKDSCRERDNALVRHRPFETILVKLAPE